MSRRLASSSESAGRLMATWLKRGSRPERSATGTLQRWVDHGLAGHRTAGQAAHDVEDTVERHVDGFDEQSGGQLARREERERVVEPARVVAERAGDVELVEQDAVG